jgi:hypothetical protein
MPVRFENPTNFLKKDVGLQPGFGQFSGERGENAVFAKRGIALAL